MHARTFRVLKPCAALVAALSSLALTACSGGSGAAPSSNTTPAPTVTQSSITLPSSVQVVSAK